MPRPNAPAAASIAKMTRNENRLVAVTENLLAYYPRHYAHDTRQMQILKNLMRQFAHANL